MSFQKIYCQKLIIFYLRRDIELLRLAFFKRKKIKITKLGKLRLTKSNNMRTIWTTSWKDLSLNCVIV